MKDEYSLSLEEQRGMRGHFLQSIISSAKKAEVASQAEVKGMLYEIRLDLEKLERAIQ